MPVVISLLRGVNVGHHKRIKMDALRSVYESLGLSDPQTYLQSGNVVFKTKDSKLAALAKRIEEGIEQAFGFHSDVILRTQSELKDVVARNPFVERNRLDPAKLLVIFLASGVSTDVLEKLHGLQIEPEEVHAGSREVFVYYTNGMARPKLPPALIEKTLRVPGTGRNWNSVTQLIKIAEKLESGG